MSRVPGIGLLPATKLFCHAYLLRSQPPYVQYSNRKLEVITQKRGLSVGCMHYSDQPETLEQLGYYALANPIICICAALLTMGNQTRIKALGVQVVTVYNTMPITQNVSIELVHLSYNIQKP